MIKSQKILDSIQFKKNVIEIQISTPAMFTQCIIFRIINMTTLGNNKKILEYRKSLCNNLQ